ncbi:hypothetical protein K1719_017630 [Acacia pycnantha]|nr:hypothetical protein K1719_017630 [Acacia pycnantha]
MFRVNRVIASSPRPWNDEQRPLIDLDSYSCVVKEPSKYDDQLRDLIGAENIEKDDDVAFAETQKDIVLLPESSVCNYGLVKRR